MKKDRLRFLLLLLVAAVVFFSCASDGGDNAEASESLVPLVDGAAKEPSADKADLLVTETLPAVEELIVSEEEQPAADEISLIEESAGSEDDVENVENVENVEINDIVEIDEIVENIESEDIDSGIEDVAVEEIPFEDEFIPVYPESAYTLDVSSYYDDFIIDEDDFVAVEVPSPEFESEQVEAVPESTESELAEPAEPELDEAVAVLEEVSPVVEEQYIPAPREDMKKPVSVISESEAAEISELEKENDVSEVEEILAAIPEPEEPAGPIPSRSVTIHKNDIIEIPYQGNWWVYLGDVNGSNTLTFSGREFVSEKTVFRLRAVKEGESLLHFYKQDIIAGVLIDDYLEVIVGEAESSSDKITLDMFVISQVRDEPLVEQEESEAEGELELPPAETFVQIPAVEETSVSYSPVITDEYDVVSSAFEEVEDVAQVDEPAMLTDAELYEKAQELEATDIEGALELYRQLVSNYPASPYWTKANNRITYINRFYFFKR